jgi:hypothetical protein
VSDIPPIKVRIIRTGSGQAQAEPPRAQLKVGEQFRMLNMTNETVQVHFDAALVTPQNESMVAGEAKTFTAALSGYVEYDAVLTTSGIRAEGNSRPGVIIDP